MLVSGRVSTLAKNFPTWAYGTPVIKCSAWNQNGWDQKFILNKKTRESDLENTKHMNMNEQNEQKK